MAEHNDLGAWGEDKAQEYLESKDYVILERDWKDGKRDLDIIAETPDGELIVFVEVKTRTVNDGQMPEEAVDLAKIKNLRSAANVYVKTYEVDKPLRFDIISITGSDGIVQRFKHIEDAFNPLLF
ncbi:YraN family protein [Segatella bryantii]|uniref:YraN family protein n=1 Tax=Segatella bryantii TaxID=77095 RepID=UPI00243327D2|nr:YraN family protein [Segatella bryantii]